MKKYWYYRIMSVAIAVAVLIAIAIAVNYNIKEKKEPVGSDVPTAVYTLKDTLITPETTQSDFESIDGISILYNEVPEDMDYMCTYELDDTVLICWFDPETKKVLDFQTSLKVLDNVEPDMCKDDILKLYGEPDNAVDRDYDYSSYSYKVDEGGSISFAFHEDKLHSVLIDFYE